MRGRIAPFLALWILLAPQLGVAVEQYEIRIGCPLAFTLIGELAYPDEGYKAYDAPDIKKVVFLSDGPLDGSSQDLAYQVAKHFTDQHRDVEVIKGDLVLQDSTHPDQKNLKTKRLNNQEKLDLPDNSADRVVMRKGMCLCEGGAHTCGGVLIQVVAAKRFFFEVGRVLNKNNPNSGAFLEGPYGQTPGSLKVWATAMDEVNEEASQKKLGFRVNFITSRTGIFRGIHIYPVAEAETSLGIRRPLPAIEYKPIMDRGP